MSDVGDPIITRVGFELVQRGRRFTARRPLQHFGGGRIADYFSTEEVQ